MAAPFVMRKRAEIAAIAEPERRAILSAELACYLARVGEFEEAELIKSELRKAYGHGSSPSVSIMIMCLEALLIYYKELGVGARDRMLRANLLSRAFRQDRLSALTSAWMAHIDFNQNRIEAMSEDLGQCFQTITPDNEAAFCRVSLVLGDAFLFVGNVKASRIWYEKARQHAVSLGDQAAVGAVTYNKAALRVSLARFQHLSEPVPPDELSMLGAEVQSAINYQAIAEIKSLNHLLDTARVGVLMLREMYEAAEPEVERLLAASDLDPDSGQAKVLRADMNLIQAMKGNVGGLAGWVESVPRIVRPMISPDDRAVVLNAAVRVANVLSMPDIETSLAVLLTDAIADHVACTKVISSKIARYESGVPAAH